MCYKTTDLYINGEYVHIIQENSVTNAADDYYYKHVDEVKRGLRNAATKGHILHPPSNI
jgi:hypothetical protein